MAKTKVKDDGFGDDWICPRCSLEMLIICVKKGNFNCLNCGLNFEVKNKDG